MENFTIRDFSGGLNTATDEANLPANMTASLLNVDFMSSGAITRRRGYTAITATPIATSPVQALYRYYKKDGTSYWAAVAGTALYTSPFVASETPWTTLQAESATYTGSNTSVVSDSKYSGGAAVSVPVSATFTVPKATNIVLFYRSPTCTASLSIDGGAWTSDTGPERTWSVLAATQHTVRVKLPDNNTKSALLTADAGESSCIYRDLPMTGVPYTIVMWMYDSHDRVTDVFDAGRNYGVEVVDADDNGWGMGAYGALDDYAVSEAGFLTGSWSAIYGSHAGTSGRYRKWYKLEFRFYGNRTDFYWDDSKIYTIYHSTAFYPAKVRAFVSGGDGNQTRAAFDDFCAQSSAGYGSYDAGDIFTTLGAWNTGGTTSTAPAITSSFYGTAAAADWTVDVDRVKYAALSAWTKKSSTLTASTAQFAFATLNDDMYFCSAYDGLQKFDGSTVSAVTASGTTAGDFLIEKGRRLFSTGDATDPNLLRYTSLDNPHDWTGGGYMYLSGQDSGGKPTGLAVWNDYLFAFTDSRCYALSTTGTPENWESKVITMAHGCIAPRSLAVAANGIIFLSGDGVRGYGYLSGVYSDDGSAFYMLSGNIESTIRAYSDAEKQAAVGAVYDNRYWLSIGGDVYVCDLEKRTQNKQPPWTKYSGHDINCLCVTRADQYGLYAGSAKDGTIYRLDYGSDDDGASIPILYRTPPLAAKGYTSVKHFRATHIAAEASQAQNVTVEVTTDDVSAPAQTVKFDADSDLRPKRLVTSARGRYAQVEVSSDGVGQDLTISEITMTYNPKPRVR